MSRAKEIPAKSNRSMALLIGHTVAIYSILSVFIGAGLALVCVGLGCALIRRSSIDSAGNSLPPISSVAT